MSHNIIATYHVINIQAAINNTVRILRGQGSVRAQHNATLQLGLEKVLSAVGGVASSENTRDHHQHMLITKSGELKSEMNELFSLLEGEDDGNVGMIPANIEEIVSKSKELTSQLRREVRNNSYLIKFMSFSSLSLSLSFSTIKITVVSCCDGSRF